MKFPKKIHYCWFGGAPLDDLALKCIESWKKYFPEYEIIKWDESNFDITQVYFMEKAYRDKKWAFVSDVARLLIVYEHGGIYFDTDVEVIRSYEDIFTEPSKGFLGFEKKELVNSGLGFGMEPQHPFLKELIDEYKKIDYDAYKDSLEEIACTLLTTKLLEKKGMVKRNQKQNVEEMTIYPLEYFSPLDYYTGKLKKTSHTHSIHWYVASWQGENKRNEHKKLQKLNLIFGERVVSNVFGIMSCMKNEGFYCYIKKRIGKLVKKKNQLL